MTPEERDTLRAQNAEQLATLSRGAAGMVKSVLHELERNGRDTYIRLRDAEPDGHVVSYDFVEGDRSLIPRVGGGLGVRVTDTSLEVPGGR